KPECKTCSEAFESFVEYEHHRNIFFTTCAYHMVENNVCGMCNTYYRNSDCRSLHIQTVHHEGQWLDYNSYSFRGRRFFMKFVDQHITDFRLNTNILINLKPIYTGPCGYCSKPFCMTIFSFLVGGVTSTEYLDDAAQNFR
ncbi:unnamed protein product, partial [Hymenolepis diminuta]